jgi:hypothetical protein
VKNRFQSLPFKCNLQRYTAGAAAPQSSSWFARNLALGAGAAMVAAAVVVAAYTNAVRATKVGRFPTLTPPDPYTFVAERRLVPKWLQPLHLSRGKNRFQNVPFEFLNLRRYNKGEEGEGFFQVKTASFGATAAADSIVR